MNHRFSRSLAGVIALLAIVTGCTDTTAPTASEQASPVSANIRIGGRSIAITDGPATMTIGQRATYTAVATDIRGRALPPGAVIWCSSRPGVIRMNGNVATALKTGTATIIASFYGGIAERQVTVTVAPPDPTHMALTYQLRTDTTERVSLINSDGTNEQLFPGFGQGYHHFDLSPDRSRLAFGKAFDNRLFTSAADGSDLQVLVPSGVNYVPRWSADGRLIVWAREVFGGAASREVFRMDANGANQTQLTFNGSEDNSPSFSPDQTKVLFQSNRSGSFEIWVMNADGSAPTQLTSSSAVNVAPAWSPDGRRIAFVSNRSGTMQVHDMASDGSDVRQLTRLADLDGNVPTVWSPDGSRLAIGRRSNGQTAAWLMNPDGSGLTQFRVPDASRSVEFIASWRR